MKPRLLWFLRCPIDGGELELVEWESSPSPLTREERARILRHGHPVADFEREVKTGCLVNRRLHVYYPVVAGVPRLLVFPTKVSAEFAAAYRTRLGQQLPGCRPPSEAARPGEQAVLASFSSEWLNYEWDDRAYWNQTPEDMYRSMDFVLDLDAKDLRDRLVLEVGIGVGGIADHVARSKQCELIGIDLSHAVDAAYRQFGQNPFFHIVQASLFAPPFADASFDFVYSQGVIHHTHSTAAAFRRIARLARPGGSLYVWVYSRYDERRTPLRRVLMALESALRPVYSRLPGPLQTAALAPWAPLYVAHQRWRARADPHQTTYGWREAMHAARDRWTPRYVHRHTDEEVSGWFRRAGYGDIRCLSAREAPGYVVEGLTTCVGIEGVRTALAATDAGEAAPPAG